MVLFIFFLLYYVKNKKIVARSDRDGDGVPDDADQCCDTRGGDVDSSGCPGESDAPITCSEQIEKELASGIQHVKSSDGQSGYFVIG